MSKARLSIPAVTVEERSVAEASGAYGVSRSWIYELLAALPQPGRCGVRAALKASSLVSLRDTGRGGGSGGAVAEGTVRVRYGCRCRHHRPAPDPPPPAKYSATSPSTTKRYQGTGRPPGPTRKTETAEPTKHGFSRPRCPKTSQWSWRWDSNPQPAVYKTAALPIAPLQHAPFPDRPVKVRKQSTGCRFDRRFSSGTTRLVFRRWWRTSGRRRSRRTAE